MRMLNSSLKNKNNLCVLTQKTGWFSDAIEKQGFLSIKSKFPSARSFLGRILLNIWLYFISKKLNTLKCIPDVIIANNHTEAYIAYKLQKYFPNAKTAVFFRESRMNEHDYQKYGCHLIEIKMVVSEFMASLIPYVQDLHIIEDGLLEEEFMNFNKTTIKKPYDILVIGGAGRDKGWDIAIRAFELIDAKDPNLLGSVTFTGVPPDEQIKSYNIPDTLGKKIHFAKRFEKLSLSAMEYDFVVSASREESFGMASLEILATGQALISSDTGVINRVLPKEFLFQVEDYHALAEILLNIHTRNDLQGIFQEVKRQTKELFGLNKEVEKMEMLFTKKG